MRRDRHGQKSKSVELGRGSMRVECETQAVEQLAGSAASMKRGEIYRSKARSSG